MAEGARLESVYTFIAYRGFESLSLRQIKKAPFGAFFIWCKAVLIKALSSIDQHLVGLVVAALRRHPEGVILYG